MDMNTGPYSLENERSVNREILEYESWLLQKMEFIVSVSPNGRQEIRSLKKRLLILMEADLEAIAAAKAPPAAGPRDRIPA